MTLESNTSRILSAIYGILGLAAIFAILAGGYFTEYTHDTNQSIQLRRDVK